MTLEHVDADALRPARLVLDFHLATQSPEAGIVEISAAGELDLATSGLLGEAVDVCLRGDAVKTLIIELHDLTFIDATGLRALWHARQQAQSVGCELVLSSPSQAVTHLLTLTKLDKLFAVVDPVGLQNADSSRRTHVVLVDEA
jgi:anti-anti-sigma factor